MADTIDIVEHDVMEKVKAYFPDISIVKVESLDEEYGDDVSDVFQEKVIPNIREVVETNFIEIHNADSTTDIGMEHVTTPGHESPHIVTSTIETSIAARSHFGNKIILGVKKTKSVTKESHHNTVYENRCFQTKLELEDWGLYLERSKCYCHACHILFPTVNTFDYHKMTVHSHLVAVEPVEPMPFEPAANSTPLPLSLGKRNGFTCTLCKMTLSNKANLHRHYKNIHKLTPEHKAQAEVCFVCRKVEPSKDALIKHLYEHHYNKNTYSCKLCSKTFDTKDELEEHLYDHARDKYMELQSLKNNLKQNLEENVQPSLVRYSEKVVKEKDLPFQCKVCQKSFSKATSLASHKGYHKRRNYRHKLKKHAALFMYKCKICNIQYKHYQSCHEHIRITHRTTGKNFIIKIPVKDVKINRDKPKSQLYKCKICSEVYGTAVKGSNHIVNVHKARPENNLIRINLNRNNKGTAIKNDKVKRLQKEISSKENTSDEEEINSEQRMLLEKYQNMAITWNVLFECKECNVVVDCFTELIDHCQDHYCKGDQKMSISKCNLCNLSFDEKCYDTHYKLHIDNREINRGCFNVIKFDYSNFLDKTFANILSESLPNPQHIIKDSIYRSIRDIKLTVKSHGQAGFTVYICDRCQLVIREEYVREHALKFSDGSCVNLINKWSIQYCQTCELTFVGKVHWLKHGILHANNKFSKKNLRIVMFNRVQDVESNSILQNIDSVGTTHDDGQKYVLFKCNKCNVVIEPFRTKKHLLVNNCHMARNHTECPHCGLRIYNNSFNDHIQKHLNKTYTKDNMEIILFDKKGSLSNENSNLKYTVYRCTNCKRCVHSHRHLNKHKCKIMKKIRTCMTCSLSFGSKCYYKHTEKHKTEPDYNIKNINIIYFNSNTKAIVPNKNVDDRAVHAKINVNSEIKITYKQAGTYVFYQCKICHINLTKVCYAQAHQSSKIACHRQDKLQCTKCQYLFHRSKMHIHDKYHKTRSDYQRKNFRITYFDRSTSLLKDGNSFDPYQKYLHYQCPKCFVITKDRYKALKHHTTCSGKEVYMFCKLCKYLIFKKAAHKHMALHEMYPEMNRQTMAIVKVGQLQFETASDAEDRDVAQSSRQKLKTVQTVRPKIYTLYKCVKCTICIHNPIFIRKHLKRCANISKSLCTQCGFWFSEGSQRAGKPHYLKHKLPNYTRDNIQVVLFDENGIIGNEDNDISKLNKTFKLNVKNEHPKIKPQLKLKKRAGVKRRYSDDSDYKNYSYKVKRTENEDRDDTPEMALKTLYKCTICDVCYLTEKSFIDHVTKTPHTTPLIKHKHKCKICGFNLSKKSLTLHLHYHHNIEQLEFKDFTIVTSSDPKFSSIERFQLLHQTMMGDDGIDLQDASVADVNDGTTDDIDISLENSVDEATKSKQENPTALPPVKYEIYKCKICDTHFMTRKTFVAHSRTPHDRPIIKHIRENCELCGLRMSKASLKYHMSMHHMNRNLKLNDFIIITNQDVSSDNYAVCINSKILYKCTVCDIHFLTKTSIDLHCRYKEHRKYDHIQRVSCEFCTLPMTNITHRRHLKIHHGVINNYKLEDFIILTEKDLQPGNEICDDSSLKKIIDSESVNEKTTDITDADGLPDDVDMEHTETEDTTQSNIEEVKCGDSTTINIEELNSASNIKSVKVAGIDNSNENINKSLENDKKRNESSLNSNNVIKDKNEDLLNNIKHNNDLEIEISAESKVNDVDVQKDNKHNSLITTNSDNDNPIEIISLIE